MLLEVTIEEKHAGSKLLLKDTGMQIQRGEVIGFVGRNGVGKTTLLRIVTGEDTDYVGTLRLARGIEMLTTEQEQHAVTVSVSALEYVMAGLRDYAELTRIIETYPDEMGEDMAKIETYTTALERYDELGYYHVRDRVIEALRAYQLTDAQIHGPFANLSGGQKRFTQLVQVEFSNADLLLLDEPTNHMDYIAKASFTSWLKEVKSAVLVISHDRDVLACVDRIVELKDAKLVSYPGNYEAYLKQNTVASTSAMHQYEVNLKTLENRREALRQAEIKKLRCKQKPNPFVPLVRRLEREIATLEASLEKPTIWIDQESTTGLKKGQSEQYAKYKAKSIRLRESASTDIGHRANLVTIDDLSLGFEKPLFAGVSLEMRAGDRVHVVGRNGAGKTTLVNALCQTAENKPLGATIFGGLIEVSPSLVIGRYEQEIHPSLLDYTLGEAVAQILKQADQAVNDEAITQLLVQYLFERHDASVQVSQLSGGQKARIQLIAIFAHRPNLLILDEPTNHLDLPSIEELERALTNYDGAILYISHDSFFAKSLGGERVLLAYHT